MVYKIALVSTHGTGKTALGALIAGELKRRGIETKVISEMATKAREIGLKINEETNLEAQLWILHSQFAKELAYSSFGNGRPSYDAVICDRGPDNYCYLERKMGRNEYALQLTLGHLQHFPYSKIYMLPIVDSDIVVGDGTRSLDRAFQKEMDLRIRKFLGEYGIGYIELPSPHEGDHYRDSWTKIVINQTLKDLGRTEGFIE